MRMRKARALEQRGRGGGREAVNSGLLAPMPGTARRWQPCLWYGAGLALMMLATGMVSSCAVVGAAADVAGAAVSTVGTAGRVVTAPVR